MSHRRLRVTLLFMLAIGLAALPIGQWPARSAQAQSELLINPGFEEPFTSQGGSVFVANGWQAWYLSPDGVTYPTRCPEPTEPTCKPYGIPSYRVSQPQDQRMPPHARSGNSQQWGASYVVYVAGLYQTVGNITPGTRLRFSVFTQAFNCSDDRGCFGGVGEVGKSYEPGFNALRVGIDPTGGTNAFSTSIVWSAFANPLDAFVQQSVEAVAQSASVTVFISSAPDYPEKHLDIYVDDASLIAVGQGEVPTAVPATPGTPAPTATPSTPQPTSTIPPNTGTYTVQSGDTLSAIAQTYNLTLDQLLALNPGLTRESILQVGQVINIGGTPQPATPTAAPTATPEPTTALTTTVAPTTTLVTSTPVSTYTPAPNGTPALANSGLCLSAFDDVDGSGTREPAEMAVIAGARFEVVDVQNQAVASYTSDGVENLHCLGNLPDGRYTISITPPAGHTATTDVKWSVSLLSGTSVNVNFGSRVAPIATATPAAEAVPTAQAAAAATPAPAVRSTGVPLGLLVGGALVLLAMAALAFAVSSRRR